MNNQLLEANSFYKRTIFAGDYVDPVYVEECSFDPQFPHNSSACRAPGIAVELLLLMSALLNFNVTLVKVNNIADLFDRLNSGEVQMSIDVKQITPERIELADYSSFPYDNVYNYQLVMKAPRPSIPLLHSAPVSSALWSVVISTAIVFWSLRMGLSLRNSNTDKPKLNFTTSFVTLFHGLLSAISLGLYANLLALALFRNDLPTSPSAEMIAEMLLTKQLKLIVSRNDTQLYNSFACPRLTHNTTLLATMKSACLANPPLAENDVERVMRHYLNRHNHVYAITHGQLEVLKVRYDHFIAIDSGISSQFKSYFFAKNSSLDIPVWLLDPLKTRYTQLLTKYGRLYAEEKRNCPYVLEPNIKPPLPLNISQLQLSIWGLFLGVIVGSTVFLFETFRNRRSLNILQKSSVAKLADNILVITLGYRMTSDF